MTEPKSKQIPSKQKDLTEFLYNSEISLYPTSMLIPNPWNTNEMTEEEFQNLKESIKTTDGEYLKENPLKIRRNGDLNKFEIVDGEHRWRACNELGIKKVPAELTEIDTDKAQKLNVIYTMNRGNINYFKLSKLLNEYYENHKITQEELAKEFGLGTQARIAHILNIYPRLKNYADPHSFSNDRLEELAGCRNDSFREKLINKSIENKWNSKTIRTQATKLNQISDYIETLTENIDDQASILESFDDDVLFSFDFVPIKNKIDSFFQDISKKKIMQGDCFDIIPGLKQEFDCIITDPPYNISNERIYDLEDRKNISTEFGEWDHFTKEEYLKFCKEWIELAASKLKEGGSILIFTCFEYGSHINDILGDLGLKVRLNSVWHKTNPTNSVDKNKDMSSCEYIIYATKGDKRIYNWLGQNKAHNFIETSICMGKERTTHPTQKPLSVLKWLLEKYTNPGDIILDPFAGSGSTGIACKEMGRNFILIEKEKKFIDIMDMRFKAMEDEN